MRLLERFRSFLVGRAPTESHLRDARGELRQFVYLDDVSLYSLTASLRGAIPTQFTDSELSALSTEIDSSVEMSAGVAKGRVGATASTSRESSSQVVRKSIVQSQFKDFYERAEGLLVLRAPTGDAPAAEDLRELLGTEWVIDSSTLLRGTLAEVEVALEADTTYRISAVMSAYLEILQEDLEAVGVRLPPEIGTIRAVNRLLDWMLAGLVPFRGTAIEWSVVEIGGVELLAHQRALEKFADAHLPTRPLVVVGVAEQRLFWRDVRRAMFSDARYRLYARISQSGLQDTWSPVKVVDVLKLAAPGLDDKFTDAFRRFPFGRAGTDLQTPDAGEASVRALAAQSFLAALADHHGVAVLQVADIGVPMELIAGGPSLQTVNGRRDFYGELLGCFEATTGFPTPREVAVACRILATAEAGLGFGGSLTPRPAAAEPAPLTADGEKYLDSEPVAIYW